MQTRVIDGFEVALLDGEPNPRIHDVEMGRRLQFKRPRKIREIIKRWYDAGMLDDTLCYRPRDAARHGGAREKLGDFEYRQLPEYEFFLGEADALFIASKSETHLAVSLTKQIIQVFMAWRRGQLAQPKTDPAIGQALAAIHEEIKAVRVLTTHIAQAVGISLPRAIAREAKSRNRRHHSLEKYPGIQLHVEHLFGLGKTYAEIQESVLTTFHLRLSTSALSRAYQRWTVRTGCTAWGSRLTLLS